MKMKELPKKDTKRLDFKSMRKDIRVCIRSLDDKYIFNEFDNWIVIEKPCYIGFLGDGTLQVLVMAKEEDINISKKGYLTVKNREV